MRGSFVLLPLLFLSACASDSYAPRGDVPVSPDRYQADLDSCESAAVASRAGHSAEGLLIGALWGAANGAAAGAGHGNVDIAAAIGAGVGAVIGFVEGLSWPYDHSVTSCMYAKGYRPA
jgi:hypothetical protein